MGKGFAIGSAALTALALFVSYAEAVGLSTIDMLNPRVIIGLLIGSATGTMIFDIAIILYAVAVLFQLITLPVELNASSRAIQQLNSLGIISAGEEQRQAKRMLGAAALTYIAAAAVAVANLLRLFLLRNNNE